MNDSCLLALGQALKAANYHFVAPTPLTYARVLARSRPVNTDPLVEAFGWNRSFRVNDMPLHWRTLLSDSDLLESTAMDEHRSRVRFSRLGEQLFAHSGFPTTQANAVFFGPDTYRFAYGIRALRDRETGFSPRTIIDIGAGSGAGGLYAASLFPGARTVLADINPVALAFARVNARLNGITAAIHRSDILANVPETGDLIICNPPYLVDANRRAYRHGGGDWGCDLSLRILEEALGRLSPDGHLLLYTGAPIVQGRDMFMEAARPVLESRVRDFRYEEQDPDVFGEELEKPPYDRADRIAVILLHVKASALIRW